MAYGRYSQDKVTATWKKVPEKRERLGLGTRLDFKHPTCRRVCQGRIDGEGSF